MRGMCQQRRTVHVGVGTGMSLCRASLPPCLLECLTASHMYGAHSLASCGLGSSEITALHSQGHQQCSVHKEDSDTACGNLSIVHVYTRGHLANDALAWQGDESHNAARMLRMRANACAAICLGVCCPGCELHCRMREPAAAHRTHSCLWPLWFLIFVVVPFVVLFVCSYVLLAGFCDVD
jgi:hypothetical protein